MQGYAGKQGMGEYTQSLHKSMVKPHAEGDQVRLGLQKAETIPFLLMQTSFPAVMPLPIVISP
jgi:hypothetical protein